jgi:uncharacterized protein GlcG (DUF336 family)
MQIETGTAPPLTLAEARGYIDRALEKARELHQRGTFVVVDESGNVVSISRIEGAPVAGVGVSRAKAYMAATTQEPTAQFAERMHRFPERFSAYQAILPDHYFPGPGGMPIKKSDRVVGGMSTGPGIRPLARVPGLDPSKLLVNGEVANVEDLIIAHALDIPYVNQHQGQEVH